MRKLLLFACGFAVSCLLCVYLLRDGLYLWAAGASGLLLGCTFLSFLPCRRQIRLMAAGAILGFIWCWLYCSLFLKPAWKGAGQQSNGVSQVIGYPVRTRYGCQVEVYVQTPDGMSKAKLFFGEEGMELRPGDLVYGSFKLRPSNQGSDGRQSLYDQSCGIFLLGSGKISAVTKSDRLPVWAVPVWVGRQLQESISRVTPTDTTAFLLAILTGDRSELPYGIKQDLRTAGLSHIIAVSGMHVALLMSALFLVFGRGGKRSILFGIPILTVFVFMTGMSPSVMRAALMLVVLLLAPVFGREPDPLTSMGLAALVILLQNPWAIANAGFQLSFLAMLGLLLFARPLLQSMQKSWPWRSILHWQGIRALPIWFRSRVSLLVRRLVQGLLTVISTTISATILTLPLTACLYGTVGTYFLLSNCLCLWLMSICFIGGLAAGLLGLIWTPLGKAAGWICAWPVRLILGTARGVSALPMASLPTESLYTVGFLIFAYIILALVLVTRRKRYGIPILCVLAALAGTAVLVRMEGRVSEFTITALDVGQGQCIIVRSQSCSAVIDCGGSYGDEAGAKAAGYLDHSGVDRLDALILTHYDLDHVGGAFELLREMPVSAVYLPEVPFSPEIRTSLEAAAEENGAIIVYVTTDITMDFDEGSLTVFAPVSEESSNEACLSILYTVGDYDMLVTGDMDIYGERLLLASHDLPDLELLVAGHHGSPASTGMQLLRGTSPETVIISVGRNTYGHPSQEVLDRIAKIGAVVYRTDENGDIEIRR